MEEAALASDTFAGPTGGMGWLNLAYVRRLTGDETGVEKALEKWRGVLMTAQESGLGSPMEHLVLARTAAFEGDRRLAIFHLQTMIKEDPFWSNGWPFRGTDPLWNELADSVGYQELVAKFEQKRATARAAILSQLQEQTAQSGGTPIAI